MCFTCTLKQHRVTLVPGGGQKVILLRRKYCTEGMGLQFPAGGRQTVTILVHCQSSFFKKLTFIKVYFLTYTKFNIVTCEVESLLSLIHIHMFPLKSYFLIVNCIFATSNSFLPRFQTDSHFTTSLVNTGRKLK